MKIETDEFRECLVVDGEEFSSSEDHEFEFEVLASSLRNARLSDLPHGISIRLYDRVIGSNDLYPRSPFCSFEHTEKGNFVCHVDTVFISE